MKNCKEFHIGIHGIQANVTQVEYIDLLRYNVSQKRTKDT